MTTSLPALLYRATCPRCRVLSLLAVGATLGSIRRVPIGSAEANGLYALQPAASGRLALATGQAIATGRRLALRLVWEAVQAWAVIAMLAGAVVLSLW